MDDKYLKSTAQHPLGVPFPGFTWNEKDLPNWVGHLITKYFPRPRFVAGQGATQDPVYVESPLLVYDYAVGGDTIAGVGRQIRRFLRVVGQMPEWAPWSFDNSLFVPASREDSVAAVFENYNTELNEAACVFATKHPEITVLVYSSEGTFNGFLDSPEEYGFLRSDCKKAGGSIWYDILHPTSKVHDYVARDLAQFLGNVERALD
ncbi:hypothetical protein DXG01_017151 [Tephrocybe rancida]|nr:hypothetical protein DXG01_017151 [Tephrocybe rancida]